MNHRWPTRFRLPAFIAVACAFLLPAGQLHAHDEHGTLSGFLHFLQDNALPIQIASGVLLVAAIGLFVTMRVFKARKNRDAQPSAPEKLHDGEPGA
jgi:hypothetical protein